MRFSRQEQMLNKFNSSNIFWDFSCNSLILSVVYTLLASLDKIAHW